MKSYIKGAGCFLSDQHLSPRFTQIQNTSFEFQNNLCKSDKISRHILDLLVSKYADLTVNNLYSVHINDTTMKLKVSK